VRGEFSEEGHSGSTVIGALQGERTITLNVAGEPQIEGSIPGEVFGAGATLSLRGFGATEGALTFQPIIGEPTGGPPTARLDIQIDNIGSTNAILGYSPIRFSAAASQADSPTYAIEFGDGAFTTDVVAVHPCGRLGGPLKSRLTVVDRFGRAGVTTARFPCVGLVHSQGPVYSLIYGWFNAIQNPRVGREERRRLGFESQNGATFSGFYTPPQGNKSHFTGTLTGDRGIRIVADDGSIEFTGEVILKDTFGEVSYSVDRHLILATRGGSADGMTLDFKFNDPF
jgi:hypothetical protein